MINALKVTIGTSAESVNDNAPVAGVDSIIIKADDDNTNSIYLGGTQVTVAQNGFRLKAGQMIPIIDIRDLSELYAIGGAASQVLWILYFT